MIVKYKKADFEIRSQQDWINVENREALLLACRSVKFRGDDRYEQARAAESEAVRIWSQQIESQRPAGPRTPQIINGVYQDNDDSLLGYGCGGGPRSAYD